MSDNTFGRDFYISVNESKNLVIICKNPETHLISWDDLCDMKKRYLYKVGQRILTPFGIQTIKDIKYDNGTIHGYEWLIMVEENGNQYKPCELMGIVKKTITLQDFKSFMPTDKEQIEHFTCHYNNLNCPYINIDGHYTKQCNRCEHYKPQY